MLISIHPADFQHPATLGYRRHWFYNIVILLRTVNPLDITRTDSI
jgi:hypothetical protein